MRTLKSCLLCFILTFSLPSLAQLEGLNLAGLGGIVASNTLGALISIPLLDPAMLVDNLSGGGDLFVAFLDPNSSLGPVLGLGTGVLGAVSPLINVLIASPTDSPTFLLLEGGTVLSTGLAGLPEIPLLTAPLPGLEM